MPALKTHPAAECFRMMTDDELASLAADIAENGLRDPIIIGRINGAGTDAVIDGRNRLRACEIAGVEPRFETIELKDDDAVRAFVRSRGERRDVTKGQRAMALALLYPDVKPGKKTKGSATTLSETNKVSTARLSNARAVLRHSRDLAIAVRDGGLSLDDALAEVEAARRSIQSSEQRLARLRAEAPDIAELVEDERQPIDEAFAAFEARKAKEAAAEANKREGLLRLSEQAFHAIVAWASEDFSAAVRERIADDEFRDAMIERLRLGVRLAEGDLEKIVPGAKALVKTLVALAEKMK